MKTRIFAFVLILGIGAIAVGWIYESRLRPKVGRTDLVIPDNIDYFLTNLRYRAMNVDGALDYEFKSQRLEHYPRTDVSSIELPSVQIYRDANQWQIDALIGEFQHQDNVLNLRDRVVMQKQGDRPMQMYTDSLRFEPDQDLVSTEASILIRSKQSRIEARQAVFDLAAKIYRFNKTRATYYHVDS
ncbi:MAG: LPS export ABC transporter periplasmic protein LptC [Gammaproteobacteria bacterium]|nr:LPS export ABC transporter periplasmic protein LptC [Gammaproteobacteria bacterium]